MPINEPGRVDALNALTSEVLAGHPGITRVDLWDWMNTWPGGSFEPADRDGVHFSGRRRTGRPAGWHPRSSGPSTPPAPRRPR